MDEIVNSALLDGLAEVWKVDVALLADHLSFIITIMTGDVPTGKSLGDGILLGKELLNLPVVTAALPLRKLQIGKAIRTLEGHGIETVGEFVEAVRTGIISRRSGSHFRSTITHLACLEGALDQSTGIDWDKYLSQAGAIALPHEETCTPQAFLQVLSPTLAELLELGCPVGRARIIFERRTSQPIENRITSDALAIVLQTHGPSVKREETDLLLFLNETLIRGNFAIAGVHVREGFLSMWRDVSDCFEEAGGNIAPFTAELASRWQINQTHLERSLPILIAVLTGYPYKRLGRHTKLRAPAAQVITPLPDVSDDLSDLPVRIVLRGFRRHH